MAVTCWWRLLEGQEFLGTSRAVGGCLGLLTSALGCDCFLGLALSTWGCKWLLGTVWGC